MLKQKIPLPPEDRIYTVGWTDDGLLVLCFKYFEGETKYDGYFPFSFFDPPLVTLAELETEIVKHFGHDVPLAGVLPETEKLNALKTILTTINGPVWVDPMPMFTTFN